jgi:hypothetical protein
MWTLGGVIIKRVIRQDSDHTNHRKAWVGSMRGRPGMKFGSDSDNSDDDDSDDSDSDHEHDGDEDENREADQIVAGVEKHCSRVWWDVGPGNCGQTAWTGGIVRQGDGVHVLCVKIITLGTSTS